MTLYHFYLTLRCFKVKYFKVLPVLFTVVCFILNILQNKYFNVHSVTLFFNSFFTRSIEKLIPLPTITDYFEQGEVFIHSFRIKIYIYNILWSICFIHLYVVKLKLDQILRSSSY